ncbi:MAG: anhydro-N-acetylmuramic acid kinase [Bacillati bacterium ANGP1]|uniref:Anhydro-N-acetylmuramic acid kinase n=1 Tax=Candidatus Segetimicrobium genomatis TaxID=2569760 RepID=A0A537JPC7_9BACT|nr:MAG: anhydro-N-acetylmuramic acid kinase [Terrabacteria group bacterium ANGP1]
MTADPFARIRAKPTKTIIGLISGTSADGITAAAVEITDRPGERPGISLRGWTTTPYPAGVRQRLVDMFTEPATMQEAASLNYLLGELFASAALAAARAAGYGMDSVDLIASHGQTVAHVAAGDPANPLSRAATLQLAEAAVIAERTGRPVILLLLGGPTGRIALNLGGISNLTVLPAGTRREDVYAFDCGPANMIIDGLARRFFGEPFDRDGAHAARGRVHREMLASLMNHPFIAAAPPKAAGHEQFGRPFLQDLLARWGTVPAEDLLATATAFAAQAVALNISRHVLPRHPVEELIASGGGVHNPTLLRDLTAAVAPLRVRRIDEFGVPSDAKEALAFALLGHASLMGLPGNLPRVTGARHAAVLGKFTWPPGAAGDGPA